MAKNLINKYVWLIETIYKSGPISFKEINEKWLDQEMDDKPIALRTFHKWRVAAEDMFNVNIDCNRYGGYRYYIGNADDIKSNSLRNWLLGTIAVSNMLVGSQSLKDRILLEDVPSGRSHLAAILEAMKENRVLNITYRSYWSDTEKNYDVQPFCVKLFRQRWYVVVRRNGAEHAPWVCALDRIKSLQKTDIAFAMPEDWDAEEYFDGFIGVLRDDDYDIEDVKIKVSASQANYIRDLKIHHSQQETERNSDFSVFTFALRPTYDFQQELLWHGEELEVVEPQWLRDEMAKRISQMSELYKR